MQKQIAYETFRTLLQNELSKRLRTNNRYSLRAFARDLKVNAGCISAILNGNRPLTEKLILKFSESLRLSPLQMLQHLSQPTASPQIDLLELDMVEVLSSWIYEAICELFQTQNFRSDAKWMAKRLDLSVSEVNMALERLKRLGWIEMQQGKWRLLKKFTDVQLKNKTSKALRELQFQSLELSRRALETVALENRYHATMTMAIDPSQMEEARNWLREFRQKFCIELEKSKDRSEVYQLNIGFFPLTRSISINKKKSKKGEKYV